MSWLVRSITNSLRLDDDDNGESNNPNNLPKDSNQPHPQSDPPSPEQRGVKEDLSDLTQTLTRQFWGVASFLAPPPQAPDPSGDDSDRESSDAAGIEGIRSDIAEIGGKFKSGISKLSSNIGVSDFSKIASSFLQLGSEEQEGGYNGSAVGVTEEVVAFARDVAMHPETWMDFPLPEEDDDDEGTFFWVVQLWFVGGFFPRNRCAFDFRIKRTRFKTHGLSIMGFVAVFLCIILMLHSKCFFFFVCG